MMKWNLADPNGITREKIVRMMRNAGIPASLDKDGYIYINDVLILGIEDAYLTVKRYGNVLIGTSHVGIPISTVTKEHIERFIADCKDLANIVLGITIKKKKKNKSNWVDLSTINDNLEWQR